MSYFDAIKYYGSDKVDYRYKKIFTPRLLINSTVYIVCFFNSIIDDFSMSIIKKILSKYDIHSSNCLFNLKPNTKNSYKFDLIMKKALELEVDMGTTALLLLDTSLNRQFVEKIKKITYDKIWEVKKEKYALIWIVDYPYFEAFSKDRNLETANVYMKFN